MAGPYVENPFAGRIVRLHLPPRGGSGSVTWGQATASDLGTYSALSYPGYDYWSVSSASGAVGDGIVGLRIAPPGSWSATATMTASVLNGAFVGGTATVALGIIDLNANQVLAQGPPQTGSVPEYSLSLAVTVDKTVLDQPRLISTCFIVLAMTPGQWGSPPVYANPDVTVRSGVMNLTFYSS